MTRKSVAIMQPYLFPYLGYLGLMAHVDTFVVLDCVQFTRRGRIHRTQVPGPNGTERWLTLPLARAPQSVRIADLRFHADAPHLWQMRLAMHDWTQDVVPSALNEAIQDLLVIRRAPVCDFLVDQLVFLRDAFGLTCEIVRSSDCAIDPMLRGADRLIALARTHGACRYVNAPGGRSLYSAAQFAPHGIELTFLPDYAGPYRHVLPSLMMGNIAHMALDLERYASMPLIAAEDAHA